MREKQKVEKRERQRVLREDKDVEVKNERSV